MAEQTKKSEGSVGVMNMSDLLVNKYGAIYSTQAENTENREE